MVGLEEFNAMDDGEATVAVRACVDIERWVDSVVGGRPYADRVALMTAAEQLADTWTDAEVAAALADHPRIGERHQGSGASASASRAEQAGVADDDDVRARLADGNRRYEETFDRIYLVRAVGRSAEEMLDLLEQRLGNDPETERRVTREQLAEIALLRLERLVA